MSALLVLVALALSDHPCAACHPGVVERFARHGMSRALSAAAPSELVALDGKEWTDARSGFTFRVEASAERAALVELRAGPPGLPPHRRELPIVGFVGAGVFDRSLVLERDGLRFFAPVEWSTSHGVVPAPHQEFDAHSRFSFALTRECLECHASPSPRDDWPAHRADGAPLSGLDCAACHGDARRHVEEAGAPGTIPRLASLAPARQLDVCARCHLQGDARIPLARADDAPFAPGDDLFLRRAAFVPRAPTDEFGFVSQSDRMARSACFTKSAGRMTCTTCHDPHESSTTLDAAQIDASCAKCHVDAERTGCSRTRNADEPMATRGCATCHMPRSWPHDLRHVKITDHWIRRSIPRATEPAAIRVHSAADGDVVRFRWPLPGEAPPDPREDALARAMADVQLGHADRALAAFDSKEPAPPRLDRLAAFHFLRGRAFESAGRASDAVAAYRDAIAREPRDPESRTNLGRLLVLQGSGEAEPLLRALASDFPHAAAPWRNLAGAAAAHGDRAGFIRCLEEAVRRDSDLPSVLLELGRARLSGRDFKGALDALRAAVTADPDLAHAWTWFGVALFQNGEKAPARAALTEALRRDPKDADAKLGIERTSAR